MIVTEYLNKSITRRTLFKVGIRVALVIISITAISYIEIISLVTSQTLDQVQKYVSERGRREQIRFDIATSNHQAMKREIIERLEIFGDADPRERFDNMVALLPDGTTRTRREGFDGLKYSSVFIGRETVVDADLRRRLLTFVDIGNQYGPALHNLFQNIYFTTPENTIVTYWPEVPTWNLDLSPDMNLLVKEWVYIADKKHNPERKTVFTSTYYDLTSDTWFISVETPVYLGDRQIATIGHDLTLNEVMERTINDHLAGTHNFIVRRDGQLIAHPEFTERMKGAEGIFDIGKSDNDYLKKAMEKIRDAGADDVVIDFEEYGQYLVITNIKGPDWIFVNVYPKQLVSAIAFDAARVILLLGLASLVLELLIFALVIKKDIAGPLSKLLGVTNTMGAGDFGARVDVQSGDEIGNLGTAFNQMATTVQSNIEDRKQAEIALQELNEGLEKTVEIRTTELRDAQDELLRKERLSSIGQITATVSHELRNPLGAIRSGIEVIKKLGDEASPQKNRAIALIDRAEKRCDIIITDLLDFARVRDLDRKVMAVDDWLVNTLDDYALSPDVTLRRELNAGVSIEFDPERLRRVLLNVMDNACQAVAGSGDSDGEARRAEILVTTQVTGNRLVITVSDNGPGIAPDDLVKVFEPLYTTKTIGVGLGLPLVRQIMEQHGGGVEIMSEIGHGTKVDLWLPLQSST